MTNALSDRWPTALGIVSAVGGIVLLVLLDRDVETFGPVVVMMAAIYLMAYALGRPWTAWIALFLLSVVMAVLLALSWNPPVGMTVVAVALWLWTLLVGRYKDGSTFALQTAGLVAVTLVCAAVAPRWGLALAGVGFLGHGGWDAYHFIKNKVVNRQYSEYCGVVDVIIGPALILAALL
jgi:hypothetical protein